jgi:putative transposase
MERRRQALGNATPAECYQASPRRWDGVLREPDYPVDHEVRRVRSNGEIKWRGKLVYLNCALAGEPVGLVEDAAGWTVSFGPVVLGSLAHGADRLRKPKPARCGLVDDAARRPQGSTASAAAADLNGTRIVSPISSVRPVTHVPDCSADTVAAVRHRIAQRPS